MKTWMVVPGLIFGMAARPALAQDTGTDTDTTVLSREAATAGLQANWHFTPERRSDPWVGLASGWRGMWFGPDQGHGTA